MSVEIIMPALSPGMTEGKLARWLKQVGDCVRAGEPIAEIETDKAVLQLESTVSGHIERLLVQAGDDAIPVNQPVALLSEAPADAPTVPPPLVEGVRRVRASPLARRMMREAGVGMSGVSGTGPGGRIVAADIEHHRSAAAHRPVPHSQARRTLARRLLEAKTQIPHFYVRIDCQVDALIDHLRALQGGVAAGDRPTLNDLIVHASAQTLREFPLVNSRWADDAIYPQSSVDIAIATSTPDGLMTPIVWGADSKDVLQIAKETRELIARARQRKLRPEEFQGGTFTVSNLGMYGVREFSAIINPPQAAILAVGAAEPRASVRNGAVVAATIMTVTLSCDHRVMDGALAAQFLAALRSRLEGGAA